MSLSTQSAAEIDFAPAAEAISREQSRVGQALRRELSDNRILIALCVIFVITANVILDRSAGGTVKFLTQLPISLMLNLTMAVYAGVIISVLVIVTTRPKSPIRALWARFRASRATILARAILFIGLGIVVLASFSRVKQNIGLLNPFWLDSTFIAWDAFIHGGQQPWALLQPLIGYPIVTDALDYLYYTWFPVFYVTFYWQAFRKKNPALRRQYLLSFFACWIFIGALGAYFLSSAGPAFLSKLNMDSSQFDGLLTYLYQVKEFGRSINALVVEETLWLAYTTDLNFPYEGISAMPSMHVAIATLMALLGWRLHWAAGLAYTIFALLIFIGSIHLAFHYAVDGYVAALMTVAIWFVAGWLTKERQPPPAPAPVPAVDENALLRARVAKLMARPR